MLSEEAVEVDGGNGWRKLKFITIPMVSPVIFYNAIISSFQAFDKAFILIDGGAIMSETGLNLSPAQENPKKNRSWFNHITHWGRFEFFSPYEKENTSADYILPLFRIFWEEEWTGISDYSQLHDMYDGVLTTYVRADNARRVQVTNWFDGVHKDAAGVIIDISADADFKK